MARDALISVVVPSYRHERYIEGCLRSVAAQSHERIELVVLDDHSPDRCFEVAGDILAGPLAGRFERVLCLRNDGNLGAPATINRALGLTTGDRLALLNSDDRFAPKRLERLAAAMDGTGAEFAFSSVELLVEPNPDGSPPGLPDFFLLIGARTALEVAAAPSVGFALLRRNVALSTGNFLFSRPLLEAVGGFAPLDYCHDWDFALQALRFTEPVFVPEPLYGYRVHGANSFSALEHVARAEEQAALRRFFRAAVQGATPNRLCPSPANWPGLFEAWTRAWGHGPALAAEAEAAAEGVPTATNPVGLPASL